jgi:hypothetical protein
MQDWTDNRKHLKHSRPQSLNQIVHGLPRYREMDQRQSFLHDWDVMLMHKSVLGWPQARQMFHCYENSPENFSKLGQNVETCFEKPFPGIQII